MSARERGFLIDWSAYARILLGDRRADGRRVSAAAVRRFNAAVVAGRAWVCPPFRLEALFSAGSPSDYAALQHELAALPEAVADAECWTRAERAQAELAGTSGVSHRVKPIDLVIAAIASRNGLAILHYDHDYDVIAEHTSLAFESRWIAPRGSID